MGPSKCAHELHRHERSERVRELMSFYKTASTQQLRLLLTLGADPTPLYNDCTGEKILEKRKSDGSICESCYSRFKDFLDNAKDIHNEVMQMPRNKRSANGMIALTLDGGGIRGLVSVVILLFASRRLFGNERLPNVFDWLIGTSTGSMLALTLAKGSSLTDAFFLYWEMKDQIFLKSSTTAKRLFGATVDRQTKNVDKVLEKCFPDHFTFASCSKRLTVPTLDVSKRPARLHVFRNYRVHSESYDVNKDDVRFRDAARASSAAPTYFHPLIYKDKVLVDGSFVANCPLNILFKEFDQCNIVEPEVSLAAVISIGTGEPSETARKLQNGTSIPSKWKYFRYVVKLLLEQVVGHEKFDLESARYRCLNEHIPFLRISPDGIRMRIDQINDDKLTEMIWTTLKYMKDNVKQVDFLGDILFKVLNSNGVS
uniref:PNPLA domain-containing protein n=1 Tax=Syphacia muris TaxID=451379 RepID=A0A0N5AWA2_9BILA